MPEAVHFLQGPLLDWYHSRIACGVRGAYSASWDRALVTCPQCLTPRAPLPPPPEDWMPEKIWQETLLQVATRHGWRHFHPYDTRKSTPGWPDLVLVKGPRMLCCELKSALGRVTPAQQAWLEALGQVQTVEVYVWRPDDLDAALEVLR